MGGHNWTSLQVDHGQNVQKILKCSPSIEFSKQALEKDPIPLRMYSSFVELEVGGLILDPSSLL